MTKRAFRGLFLFAVFGALLFRTVRLDLRPMHHDEANQAVKFGQLLERGEYRYDPNDHHGPSLYYLTLPFALVASGRSLAALNETTIRLLPALAGTAVLVTLLLFAGGLTRESIAFGALLAAASPAMTYYSRFYIQEMLLVLFLALFLGMGWKYVLTRSAGWAAGAGFAAGMMYATKETSLILFGAVAAALLLARLLRPVGAGRPALPVPKTLVHAGAFAAAAIVTAGLLYTSFLSNPRGLLDSVLAFGTYFGRAAGAGVHAHPWSYYFQMLAYSKFGHGPAWSEAFVLALAVAGSVSALGSEAGRDGDPRLIRFVFFFTVVSAAVYSAIPYKTPWNVLPFYLGILILAGCGAGLMWRAGRFLILKAAVLAVLLPGLANLAFQDYRANFMYYASPENPYVYAQTSLDYMRLVHKVEAVAAASPNHHKMLIKVVAPPDKTWPLPWSLRRFPNVGYWTSAAAAGALGDASAVIVSASESEQVAAALGDRFQSAFYGLRPEVVLTLFVRNDLWDASLKAPARAGL